MDVRESVRCDVPLIRNTLELLDKLTDLLGRATPGVVVAQYSKIKRCAARHRRRSLTDLDSLSQPSLQCLAHAHHVDREDEAGIDFQTLLAFRDRLVIPPRQVQRVGDATVDEGR